MMNSTTRLSRSLPALALGTSLMLAPLGVAHAETTPATAESASTQPSDSNLSRGERALTQTLSAEQPVASGRTEISAGHVDMFSLYLENGNFSAPQVLWSSTKNEPQKLWVEKNTHTHANWVFTAPGEYLLKVTASAELSDGSTLSDTRYLKFAVGDSANADALYAMEAQARGSASSGSSAPSDASSTSASQAAGSSSAAASDQSGYRTEFTIPWGVIAAGVAAVIAVGAFLAFRRRSSAQREALDEVRGDRS